MGEASEAEGDAAEVFEAAVDCFGGAVGAADLVEVGEDVACSAFQGAPERDEFGQPSGHAGRARLDDRGEFLLPGCGIRIAVGVDEALVDAPGGLDGGMRGIGKQPDEPGPLFVFE